MAKRPNLMILGIDAASGSLVRQWATQGILPNLAQLMRRGRTATLRGVDGFFTGATWPSLLTSTSPARHGIHYLAQLVPGTYEFALPHEAEYIRAPMFWEALSNAGKQLAILDVPLSKLDPTVRGIQTVEWAGHDSIFGFGTSPGRLAAEILGRHGRHPVPTDCDAAQRTTDDFQRFADTLVQGVEAKVRLTRDLATRESWDLFMQVFTETHCAGHQCWHLHDPRHPAHDPHFLAVNGDPLQRVYEAVDRAIGELIEAAGNPPVMVLLPHGMSHAIGSHLLLPEILSRLGLSVLSPRAPRRLGPMDVARAIGRRLPAGARELAHRWLEPPARPGSFGVPALNVDTKVSRCFAVPNGLAVSGIRLNLAGREPFGTVQPGAQADTLFRELARDLLDIEDERTQLPLVRRVLRTADLYSGPNCGRLPDILVEWNDAVAVGSTALGSETGASIRASSPKIGQVDALNRYGRSGEHRGDGLLVAAGPGIEEGGNDLSMSILDVGPTIAAAVGVGLSGVEGRVVPAMIPTGDRPAGSPAG